LTPLKPIPRDLAAQVLHREQNNEANQKKDKVDIKSLPWEDKEKILRVLFAKMNGVSLGPQPRKSKDLDDLKDACNKRAGFSNSLDPQCMSGTNSILIQPEDKKEMSIPV
jgi:hypothetical protein